MRSWQEGYRGLLPDAYLDSLEVEQHVEYWAAYLEDVPEADRLWLAEEDARIVAYVRTGPDPEDGRDGLVFGVGAEAGAPPPVEHALEDLRAREYRDATVWLVDGDERGFELFARLGFERDDGERETDFDGTSARELRLRRQLNDLDL